MPKTKQNGKRTRAHSPHTALSDRERKVRRVYSDEHGNVLPPLSPLPYHSDIDPDLLRRAVLEAMEELEEEEGRA